MRTTMLALADVFCLCWVIGCSGGGTDPRGNDPLPGGRLADLCPDSTVTLSKDSADPVNAGSSILWTASVACADVTGPEYRFSWFDNAQQTWNVARDFSAEATWTQTNTAELQNGENQVRVEVRNSGGTPDGAIAQTATFMVAGSSVVGVCRGINITTSPERRGGADQEVTITVTANGCGEAEYSFDILGPDKMSVFSRGFEASPTVTWGGADRRAGKYTINVSARRSGTNDKATTGMGTYSIGAILVHTKPWPQMPWAYTTAQAKTVFDGLTGSVGCTLLGEAADMSSQALFGGPDTNLAYHEQVKFVVPAGEEGEWRFRWASDFGFGGTLAIDGNLLEEKWPTIQGASDGNLWWDDGFDDPLMYLDGGTTLSAGEHTLEVYGFELCCDGGGRGEFMRPGGGAWQLISGENLVLKPLACPK